MSNEVFLDQPIKACQRSSQNTMKAIELVWRRSGAASLIFGAALVRC
jgi:hypothetical protein